MPGLTRTRIVLLGCTAAAGLAAAAALATPFTNSGTITIGDAQPKPTPASPYPSTIAVSGLSGTITDVNVTLHDFKHEAPDDVDVLVTSPGGTNVLLMSDAGADFPLLAPITLTFDDAATQQLPDKTKLSGGTYRPSNYGSSAEDDPFCQGEPHPEAFPSPAPSAPYGATLAGFNGQAPNGTWTLYITDDCSGSRGTIAGGWTVDVATSVPTGVAVTRLTSRPLRSGVEIRWTTVSEAHIAGFNVYRDGTKLNKRLIVARNSGVARGTTYSLLDRRFVGSATRTYRLQLVGLDGARSWAGSSTIRTGG